MNKPKITVITPTYNAERDIIKCIESVACQTYLPIEHLIIDGGSTDSTLELANKYSNLKVITEKDDGIYDAMNKGVKYASGEWIYFLGADDVLYDGAVVDNVFSAVEASCFDLIYGNVQWGDTGSVYDGRFSLLKLMQKNICHQAIFYRASIFKKIGNFDLNYKTWADWLFNIKCFCNDEVRRQYVDIIVAKFALGGHSSQVIEDIDFLRDKQSIINSFFPEEYVKNEVLLQKLTLEMLQKNQQLVDQKIQLVDLKTQIDDLKKSLSWKLTKPARVFLELIRNFNSLKK